MRHKHVFIQDVPCLSYAALGDTAVRVLAIRSIIDAYDLDAYVIPQKNPSLQKLWNRAFGNRLIQNENDIPESHRHAHVSRPTRRDHQYGENGWDVFESIWWENGFFRTSQLKIVSPILYPCNVHAKAIMVYPLEHTDGNRVHTQEWWQKTIRELGKKYVVNVLGDEAKVSVFCGDTTVNYYPPTIDGLEACIANSSVAIGGSTGPTWVSLMSDIPQVVLDSRQSPHGYWFFERCQRVLAKRLRIITDLNTLFARGASWERF